VSKLFKDHDNLILGFNTFLPPGFKIKPENLQSHQRALQQQAYAQELSQQMQVVPTPNPMVVESQSVVDATRYLS
jgi:histone deacetylase complex regulatory component SIN3